MTTLPPNTLKNNLNFNTSNQDNKKQLVKQESLTNTSSLSVKKTSQSRVVNTAFGWDSYLTVRGGKYCRTSFYFSGTPENGAPTDFTLSGCPDCGASGDFVLSGMSECIPSVDFTLSGTSESITTTNLPFPEIPERSNNKM